MKLRFNLWLSMALLAGAGELRAVMPTTPDVNTVISDSYKTGGFLVGCQAYNFNQGTLFEGIDKTKAAGAKVIELFLWQKLSAEHPDVVVDENISEEHLAKLLAKFKATGIRPVSAYVGSAAFQKYGSDEAALRKVFAFAKRLELFALVGEPPEAVHGLIEKMVKEYDVQFAIHNHRQEAAKPEYRYWDPAYTAAILAKRDPRFGVCLDFGHLVRSGLKPLDAIKLLKQRILAVHLKDPKSNAPDAPDQPFGQGVADVKGILQALVGQGFYGITSIEYETFGPNQVKEIAQCVDFLRVEGQKIRDDARRKDEAAFKLMEGFTYEIIAQADVPEPVDVEPGPDGRLWFTSRRGYIWAYDFKTKWKTVIAHLAVDNNGERGLHGIAFDPNYLKNGFVYLHYAPPTTGAHSNRVARFTVDLKTDTLVTSSEKVYLQFFSHENGFHQGGAIQYNPTDGKLYISTGDNNASPETKKFFDDPKNAPQNLADYRGKVLRLNLDGTVPKDNPFVKTPGALPEIYTYGHRNPYSMNIDYDTGRVYIGEVGYDRKEDIEEVNWLTAGGNYGWPRCIGTNNGTFGGPCPITNAIAPWIWYTHEAGGANATSGPFYRKNSGPYCFPKEFQNGMFYADYSRRWIRFAQVNPRNNTVTNTIPFARGGFGGGPLAMQMGPDGAIYVAEYGGWFKGSPGDRISRILYDPKKAAVAKAANAAK